MPVLIPDIHSQLYQYIGGILRAKGGTLMAAGGMSDHLHLLVALGKSISVSDALREIKANSSRWIHETFPDLGGFAWQTGYGAFAVSYSHLGRVKSYLAGQAEHHRQVTFQEEFVAFLKRHQIEYDARYLWD